MRFLKMLWPLLLSGLTMFSTILLCANTEAGLEKYQTVFYFTRQIIFLLTFVGVPLLLVITLFQFRHKRQSTLTLMLSLLILGISNVLACGSSFTLLINPTSQIESLSSKNHIYHVDSIFSPGIGGDHTSLLILWECDRIGLFCQIIDSEPFYDGLQSTITMDASASTLLLMVNHKVVYTRDSP